MDFYVTGWWANKQYVFERKDDRWYWQTATSWSLCRAVPQTAAALGVAAPQGCATIEDAWTAMVQHEELLRQGQAC